MVEEQKETNVEEQGLTSGEGKTEPTTETPVAQEPTVEELKTQYSELEANYKAVQRNLEAARQGGANVSQLAQQIAEIRENQAVTLDYLDALRQGEGVTEAAPAEKPQPSRLDQLKAQRVQEQQMVQQAASVAQAVEGLIKESGIDAASPELDDARKLFQEGKFGEVLPAASRAVAKLAKEKAEVVGKEMQAKADAEANKKLQEAGLLDVETGGPTAAPDELEGLSSQELAEKAYGKPPKKK